MLGMIRRDERFEPRGTVMNRILFRQDLFRVMTRSTSWVHHHDAGWIIWVVGSLSRCPPWPSSWATHQLRDAPYFPLERNSKVSPAMDNPWLSVNTHPWICQAVGSGIWSRPALGTDGKPVLRVCPNVANHLIGFATEQPVVGDFGGSRHPGHPSITRNLTNGCKLCSQFCIFSGIWSLLLLEEYWWNGQPVWRGWWLSDDHFRHDQLS